MNQEDFTASQVKALLLVAAECDPLTPGSAALRAADANQMLEEMSRTHGGSNGSLLDTATDGTTPVEELIRIKDLAKALIEEAHDGRRREAARLLYHVAVAAAFVRHGASISGRALHKQQSVYARLGAAWPGHPIGETLCLAADRLAAPPPRDQE